MAEIKRCKEPFATEVDGLTQVVSAGALVSTDDAVYSRRTRHHFEDLAAHVGEQTAGRARAAGKSVEQATAGPGEKRDLTPPAPFEPGKHNVSDVLAYLAEADSEEKARVLEAEAAGKNRASVLALREQPETPADTQPGSGDDS